MLFASKFKILEAFDRPTLFLYTRAVRQFSNKLPECFVPTKE